jgi:hypothetical protein
MLGTSLWLEQASASSAWQARFSRALASPRVSHAHQALSWLRLVAPHYQTARTVLLAPPSAGLAETTHRTARSATPGPSLWLEPHPARPAQLEPTWTLPASRPA